MNVYTASFFAKCPVNDEVIKYTIRIETKIRLMVEFIQDQLKNIGPGFHEDIADDMLVRFGGCQIITAMHHGVHIETRRCKN